MKTYELAEGIMYGPVRSRRMGLSLGVNLLPGGFKLCSFNCPYCQCGWSTRKVDSPALASFRFPSAAEVAAAVGERLRELRGSGNGIDSLTFSGNGEPTLHPDFPDVVRAVLEVRDREMPEVRVDILTNGAHLSRSGVVGGLNLLDERYVKLDAGDGAKLREMNRPLVPLELEDLVRGTGLLRDFIAQAMFTSGSCDNTDRASLECWIALVGRLRPKAVHLYSLDRRPADPGVRAVDRGRLEEIAREVQVRAGVAARVF